MQVRDRDETAHEPDWIDCEQLWRLFGAMPDLCLRVGGDAMELAGLTDGGIVAIGVASDGDDRAPPTRTFAEWYNSCPVGIDVTWQDEGECRPRGTNHYPCAWYVEAHELQPAAIEGAVRWQECESRFHGETVAVERAPGQVVCAGKASSAEKAQRQAKGERTTALTDRRLREDRALRRGSAAEAAQDGFGDAAGDGFVWCVDARGECMWSNTGRCEVAGYSRDDAGHCL